jgi:hypothetical protein
MKQIALLVVFFAVLVSIGSAQNWLAVPRSTNASLTTDPGSAWHNSEVHYTAAIALYGYDSIHYALRFPDSVKLDIIKLQLSPTTNFTEPIDSTANIDTLQALSATGIYKIFSIAQKHPTNVFGGYGRFVLRFSSSGNHGSAETDKYKGYVRTFK